MPLTAASPRPTARLPAVLTGSTFEAVIFGWDGTAVADRHVDASPVRRRVEALCAAGVDVFVVSDSDVGNIDGQLVARPSGPGRLHLCLNRGSEVFSVDGDGPELVWRRTASASEEEALDRAATLAVERLRARRIRAEVVSQPLNRRKIDLIPEPRWSDPPKARIAELLPAVTERLERAGLHSLAGVATLAEEAARAVGLAHSRVTSDAKHVEIGLTDGSDSGRWIAGWLAERGITGELILVGGDEFGPLGDAPGSNALLLVSELDRAVALSVGVEPGGCPPEVSHVGGGPETFLQVLDAQLARRRSRRVPSIDRDPGWVLPLPSNPEAQRAVESLATLGNGWAASRGAREGDLLTLPAFAVNGMYTAEPMPQLLAGPRWDRLSRPEWAVRPRPGVGVGVGNDRRLLDLRTGVLARSDSSGLRSLRFVSAAHPALLALRAEGQREGLRGGTPLASSEADGRVERLSRGGANLARVRAASAEGHAEGEGQCGGIVLASRDWQRVEGGQRMIQRLAAWAADASAVPGWDEALEQLERGQHLGFDRLLAEHRQTWAQRWADAEVCIEGAPADELAARFAVFHLLAAAPDAGEAAVGARGLTGSAYGGHVSWDADVFVLPALAAIHPAGARGMLEYRVRRLEAAKAAAAVRGLPGARFPWESAADGTDVTPRHVSGQGGKLAPVDAGDRQEHVVAAVAWAADRYAEWTGDSAFLAGPGYGLLVETARYWASRIRRDAEGRGHIYGVTGPDEYHQAVDDNTYTNVMARWNLRRAADLVDGDGSSGTDGLSGSHEETAAWRALADALVDGHDPGRGAHQQFAGYWKLEPLLVRHFAQPPVAADLLLGPGRITSSQVIKQADVVMAHHLVPGQLRRETLHADLDYYGPRTAHGSSLSPAIYAAQLARAGRPDDALALFRLAARLDLDDITGTTSGGLHLATMGGVWQALAYGFLGMSAVGTTLHIDPCLPSAWEALALRFCFRGVRVRVRAQPDQVVVDCNEALNVRIGEGPVQRCETPGHTFPAVPTGTPVPAARAPIASAGTTMAKSQP